MTHTNAPELLNLAAAHLLAAADTATRRAEDPFSPWHPFAGQLALTAAGLSPTPSRPEDDKVPRGTPEHLAAAETALDQIVGLDGLPTSPSGPGMSPNWRSSPTR